MSKSAKKTDDDHASALKQETDKVSGKIDDVLQKLARMIVVGLFKHWIAP